LLGSAIRPDTPKPFALLVECAVDTSTPGSLIASFFSSEIKALDHDGLARSRSPRDSWCGWYPGGSDYGLPRRSQKGVPENAIWA